MKLMLLRCHFFWGVPCCEKLLAPHVLSLVEASSYATLAPSILQADTLIIVGMISNKQVPFLLDTWSRFAFPSRVIHFEGCEQGLHNYALLRDLRTVIDPDLVLNACHTDLVSLDHTLREVRR